MVKNVSPPYCFEAFSGTTFHEASQFSVILLTQAILSERFIISKSTIFKPPCLLSVIIVFLSYLCMLVIPNEVENNFVDFLCKTFRQWQ